jgi:hypothetical protein
MKPATAYVDLGYRGVDADNPGVAIKHRGKYKTLTTQERKLLKRCQAAALSPNWARMLRNLAVNAFKDPAPRLVAG